METYAREGWSYAKHHPQKTHSHRTSLALLSFFAALGCGYERPATEDHLLKTFPERAPIALALEGEPFVESEGGFRQPALKGEPSTTMRRVAALFPKEGDGEITLGLSNGFTVKVRESGAFDEGVASYGHIQYRRANGSSFWSSDQNGVEEWLHVIDPEPGVVASWWIEGALAVQQEETVLLVDNDGVAHLRVSAPEAWGASGAPIQVKLEARGQEIALLIDEEAAQESELLIDPLWAGVGNMATARRLFTATALPNGKVLVTGGLGNNNASLASCELYDPATGLWSAAAPMLTARSQHTAVLLRNGSVLVTGGRDASNQPLSSTELYVPSSNSWVSVQAMANPRSAHTTTLLPSGKVLAAGGGTAASELFDPATSSWAATAGAMSAVRSYHTATALSGGRVLVVGGVAASYLSSAEIFTESTGTWQATTSLPGPRTNHTATLLRNGLVLVTGGRSSAFVYQKTAYLFNPSNQTWTATNSMSTERSGHTAALLPNNEVLIAGGSNLSGNVATYERFFINSTWSASASASPRSQQVAVLLENGKVLFAGGYDNGSTLSTTEFYSPVYGNDSWQQIGTLPEPLPDNGTATLLPDGRILLVGACWGVLPGACRAMLYNPATGVTTYTSPMNWKTIEHAATLLLDGRVLIAGGLHSVLGSGNSGWIYTGPALQSQIYDPATDTWSLTGPWAGTEFSEPQDFGRSYPTATLLPDGSVLVVGGKGFRDDGVGPYYWLPQAQHYDPTENAWRPVEEIPGRFAHTTVLTPDRKVVITGGSPLYYTNNTGSGFVPCMDDAVVFDLVTWLPSNSGPMQDRRCHHTTTLLPAGGVLAVGGGAEVDSYSLYSEEIDLLNLSTLLWEPQGRIYDGRLKHTASLLPNGTVMVTGGSRQGAPPYPTTTEIFDPTVHHMSTSPTLNHPSFLANTLLSLDNRVLQLGACTIDQINNYCTPRTQVWAYDEGRQSTHIASITSIPASVLPNDAITITGNGFTPINEASQGAATNAPTVVFLRQESELRVVVPATSFTATSINLTIPSTLMGGWYQVRVSVNGTVSKAKMIKVTN